MKKVVLLFVLMVSCGNQDMSDCTAMRECDSEFGYQCINKACFEDLEFDSLYIKVNGSFDFAFVSENVNHCYKFKRWNKDSLRYKGYCVQLCGDKPCDETIKLNIGWYGEKGFK